MRLGMGKAAAVLPMMVCILCASASYYGVQAQSADTDPQLDAAKAKALKGVSSTKALPKPDQSALAQERQTRQYEGKQSAGAAAGDVGSAGKPPPSANVHATGPGGHQGRQEESTLGGVSTKNVIGKDKLDPVANSSYDSLKNVAGVGANDAKGGAFADNFNIRNNHLISTASYRMDGGFAIANNVLMPQEDKERIEVLKGVSALLFGVAAPGGVINFIMKRPTAAPYNSISIAAATTGQVTAALDVSRRFGEGDQLGVRFNFSGGHVATTIHNTGGVKAFGAMTIDWDPTDRFRFRVDMEQFGLDVNEYASVSLPVDKNTGLLPYVNGVAVLPHKWNPTQLSSGLWSTYKAYGTNILLSGLYRFDYGWQALMEVGRSENIRLTRSLGQIQTPAAASGAASTAAAIAFAQTGNGSLVIQNQTNQETLNQYAKAELRNESKFSVFTNDFTIGINRNERDTNTPKAITTETVPQNIYNPVVEPAPGPGGATTYTPQKSSDLGYYSFDTLTMFNVLHGIAGIRYITYYADYATLTGVHSLTTTHAWAPAFGAIYDLTSKIAVYASYMKALSETGTAPTGTANFNAVLPPETSTQQEVGVRVTNLKGLSGTVGYYVINQAGTGINPLTNIFELNGTTRSQGIEGSISADLDPHITLNASGLLTLVAIQITPLNVGTNGLVPENIPKFSGGASVTLRPIEWVKGLSFTAGVSYVSSKFVNNQDQISIPSYTTYSLGANYQTMVYGRKTTFNVSCSNLTDLRYFSSASLGAIGMGAPRVVRALAKMDF